MLGNHDDDDDDDDDDDFYDFVVDDDDDDQNKTWAIVNVAAWATFLLGQRNAWHSRLPSLLLLFV